MKLSPYIIGEEPLAALPAKEQIKRARLPRRILHLFTLMEHLCMFLIVR